MPKSGATAVPTEKSNYIGSLYFIRRVWAICGVSRIRYTIVNSSPPEYVNYYGMLRAKVDITTDYATRFLLWTASIFWIILPRIGMGGKMGTPRIIT